MAGDLMISLLPRIKHSTLDKCCLTKSSSLPTKVTKSLMSVKKMVLLPMPWRGDGETMIESHSLTGRSSRTISMRVDSSLKSFSEDSDIPMREHIKKRASTSMAPGDSGSINGKLICFGLN